MRQLFARLLPFHRTLLFQAISIIVIAQTGVVIIIMLLLHSNLMFRLVPGVIDEHAEAITELAFLLESTPEEANPVVLSAFSGTARSAVILPDHASSASLPDAIQNAFVRAGEVTGYPLAEREAHFRNLRTHELFEGRRQGNLPNVLGIGGIELSFSLESGEVLVVWMTPAAFIARPSLLFVAGVWVAIVLFAAISLHLIFAPLRGLERAAHRLGQTSRPEPVHEAGSEDIRRVARALNDMQDRIQDLLADRSKMVAAVAHDIRTGLTRLRLRLDASETEIPDSVAGDLEHIETLVSDMLSYARAEQPSRDAELIELRSFLIDLIASLPYAVPQSCSGSPFWVGADKASLTRGFTNLIENARLYANDVTIRCEDTPEGLAILVEDRGPGIPEEELTKVFDPFYRLETSRNRETGGTGLGLTIARALFSAQGAVLSLHNREGGGLSARILFPAQDQVG
ncbi:MAG: HAMP domain-containing protein [Alphaproteobacteria bacterium]|nr:HAMP domain-containing protein [Alphaproteobacteria bacterium]